MSHPIKAAEDLLQHARTTGEPADYQAAEDAMRDAGVGAIADVVHDERTR